MISKKIAISDPVDHFNLLYTQIEVLASAKGIGIKVFASGAGESRRGTQHNAWTALTEDRGPFALFSVSEI